MSKLNQICICMAEIVPGITMIYKNYMNNLFLLLLLTLLFSEARIPSSMPGMLLHLSTDAGLENSTITTPSR